MQQFKNILVVMDTKDDNRAVHERAVTLALNNQARLMVVTVVEESPRGVSIPSALQASKTDQLPLIDVIEELPAEVVAPGSPKSPVGVGPQITETTEEASTTKTLSDIQEHISADATQRLEEFIESIQQKRIQVSTKVLFGAPFLEIIRQVVRNQHDLVMITAEGRGGLREKLFGGTTMHLLRKCPCPVWVIKPTQSQSYRRIMAAVDPDPSDKTRNALNTQIMELATSLAHQDQSELLVVHTWTVYGEAMLRGGFAKTPAREVDEYVQKTRAEHLRRLTTLLEKHPLADLNHQIYMLKGEADKLLPELAKWKEVDLIVMGTVCRTGVAGFLMGNTAENILQQVDCSVLTVKPEGFVTPVRLDRSQL